MQEEDFQTSLLSSRWGEFEEEKSTKPSPEKKRGKVLLDYPGESTQTVEEVKMILQPPKSVTGPTQIDNVTQSEVFDGMTEENQILRHNIVTFVSQTDAFFKSQQKDEPDLTQAAKSDIASSLLKTSPSLFLSRYGKYLQPEHFLFFEQFRGDYEVDYYLNQLKKSPHKSNVVVKNRRYQALKEMVEKGDYFSMKEMKSRNPHLFEHLIGKYMSEEEKMEMEPRDEVCNLSTVLMAHMDRDQYSSQRRKDQEAELNAWEEEFSEDEEEEEEEKDEPTEEERVIFQEEFTSTMYRQFMEGKDKEFDYSTVDENSRYDNLVIQERDEEDRYFDADED